jgi:RNA polymerase sigma factor (sigma-70 family)
MAGNATGRGAPGAPAGAAGAAGTTSRAGAGSSAPTRGAALADEAAGAFRRWRDGDEPALDGLVRRVTPLLWHLARARGADAGAAEDAVQSTWLALVRRAEDVRDPQVVLRWLTVTVQREAARTSRTEALTEPAVPEVLDLRDPDPGPEEQAVAGGAAAVLWRHVADLSERCRQLLRVVAFADRPDYATLSQELGMPVGSIGPTRGRCLARLREALAADPRWSPS